MKLVVMHYLRSLRERDELDAILPDLLAESGFEVITRPRRGTRQAGVDVAAVGPDPEHDGARSLFLFTIKSGDLTREHWDTGQQAVRPSLNEIFDDYIPNRIPPHFANLPVVICVCMGGGDARRCSCPVERILPDERDGQHLLRRVEWRSPR